MFDFTHITHLNDIRHAISEDFYLAERDWGYVINYYIGAFPEINDTMSEEEKMLEYARREFRGIKFDVNGNLIARPFHKFFNWGEKEAEMKQYDFSQPFVIMDKLDGSMIHPMRVDSRIDSDGYVESSDRLYWCSKMGPTDVAKQAEAFVKKCDDHLFSPAGDKDVDPDYMSFVENFMNSGWTPIFEWCSRKQRIVVDYPEDQLVLTAVRVNQTGDYLSFEKMIIEAAKYNIPVVKTWPGTFKGIEEFVKEVGSEEQCEGYIIRFANGHMIKLKNGWYLDLHRAKSELDSEKNVWRLVLTEKHDDLLAHLDDHARDALEKFANKLSDNVKFQAKFYKSVVSHAWEEFGNRKDFALNCAQKLPWPSVAFKILDGKDAFEAVTEHLLAQITSNAKLEPVMNRLGVRWRDYYYPTSSDE